MAVKVEQWPAFDDPKASLLDRLLSAPVYHAIMFLIAIGVLWKVRKL